MGSMLLLFELFLPSSFLKVFNFESVADSSSLSSSTKDLKGINLPHSFAICSSFLVTSITSRGVYQVILSKPQLTRCMVLAAGPGWAPYSGRRRTRRRLRSMSWSTTSGT